MLYVEDSQGRGMPWTPALHGHLHPSLPADPTPETVGHLRDSEPRPELKDSLSSDPSSVRQTVGHHSCAGTCAHPTSGEQSVNEPSLISCCCETGLGWVLMWREVKGRKDAHLPGGLGSCYILTYLSVEAFSHPGVTLRFRDRLACILPSAFPSCVGMVLSLGVSEPQFLPVKVGADVSYFRSHF